MNETMPALHRSPSWLISRVTTSSVSGIYGNVGQTNYGAAKAGVAGMTRCMALEGQKYGVRCFILAPVALTRLTEDLPGFQSEDLKTRMDDIEAKIRRARHQVELGVRQGIEAQHPGDRGVAQPGEKAGHGSGGAEGLLLEATEELQLPGRAALIVLPAPVIVPPVP